MRLLWLADVLREAGLAVEEVPGWRERGADLPGLCSVVIGHHTATPRTPRNAKDDLPTRKVLVDGRSDLPGPLCQLALGRSGTYYVVAAGKASHAGRGAWAGVANSRRTIGIEAEHPGAGSWPSAQRDAFDRGVAALLRQLGQGADHYCGHREWALPSGRKPDPGGVDLDEQRRRIAQHLLSLAPHMAHATAPPPADEEIDVDEKTLRRIIQEEVREEIRTVLGNVTGPDADPTHYALSDIRNDLKIIQQRLNGDDAARTPGRSRADAGSKT